MASAKAKCVNASETDKVEHSRCRCDTLELKSSLVDPAIKDGMELQFFKDCVTEVVRNGSELVGKKCLLSYKLLAGADVVELEITSESDLFFQYVHRVTKEEYEKIKLQQNLTTPFDTYPLTLQKMIVSCMQSESFKAILTMRGGEGTLNFVQNAEYKFIELLECALLRANEFRMVDNITYRYNLLKERVNHFAHHLEDINNVLKKKDPAVACQRLFG